MAKKKKRSSTAVERVNPKLAPRAKAGAQAKTTAAERRFVNDLVVRGEAEPRDASGKLPLQATHEIEQVNPDGSVKVKRVRFKLY